MAEKVNLDQLQQACASMARLLDDRQPGLATWRMRFGQLANEIRFELDGSESCVPEVAKRARQSSIREQEAAS